MLLSNLDLQRMRRIQRNQTAKVEKKVLEDIERREDEHRAASIRWIILAVLLALVWTWMNAKLGSLRMTYSDAYDWWMVTYKGVEYAKSTGNYPLVTIPSIATRLEFPSYAWVQQLLMLQESIPRPGAEFVMIMITHFSQNMRPIHFNGSSNQLRFTELATFLPTDQGADWTYIWSSFNAKNTHGEPVNPWSGVLWSSVRAMGNSPAIRDYYSTTPNRSFIESLYRGGLVEVAMTHGNDNTSGADMVRYLMGTTPDATPLPCSVGQKTNSAIQKGSEYGTLALGVVMGLASVTKGSKLTMQMGSRVFNLGTHHVAAGACMAAVSAGAIQGANQCETGAISLSASGN